MRNEFTTLRKQKKFTGRADKEQKLCCSIPLVYRDAEGKVINKTVDNWFTNEEWIFFKEWEAEVERAVIYSRSNRNSNGQYMTTGRSGNVIKEGNGLEVLLGHCAA